MSSTTLVTGASGHLGNTLVRALLAEGHQVRAVYLGDDSPLAGLDVERMPGDVTDAAFVRRALSGCELVFHLAAVISIDGDRTGNVRKVNVEGARTVAAIALNQGVRRMVHCCSVHAFQHPAAGVVLDERGPRVPLSGGPYGAYDRSKAEGEAAVRQVVQQGLDAVIVHPTGVIGPGDHMPSRMGQFFLDVQQRRMPALIDGGFNWSDVRDVASGMIAAAERGRCNESYLLAGHWQSSHALARYAQSATGVPAPRLILPLWVARGVIPVAVAYGRITRKEPRLTEEAHTALSAYPMIDCGKAERELGYTRRPTERTVHDLYAWFAEHRAG